MTNKLIKPLVISALVYAGSLSAQPAPAFPSYTEAVSHFLNRYDKKELESLDKSKLSFYVDEEGWGFVLADSENGDETYARLFWSAEEDRYIPLPGLPVRQSIQATEINACLNSEEARYYEILDVYGYEEWEDDQLDMLEDMESPGPGELHKLALTWQLVATYMLGGGNTYLNQDKRETQEGELLDEDDFEDVREAIGLATYYYKELIKQTAKQNEKRTIRLDYAKGIMELYLLAKQWTEAGLAESILPGGLYPASYTLLAKLQMHNCPDSALLMLHNEETLLPAIYLQANDGYRTDIALINHSMLHQDEYRRALQAGAYPFGPVDVGIKQDNSLEDPVEALTQYNADSLTNYYYCPSYDDIVFNANPESKLYTLMYSGIKLPPAPALLVLSPFSCEGLDSIHIRLPYQLSYGQALLIQLAYMPDNDRPLCLSLQIPDRELYFLDEYLELHGLYYTMSSCYREDSIGATGHADAHELQMIFNRVKEDLNETGINGIAQETAEPYRKLALRTAQEHLYEGDTAKAQTVLSDLLSLLPDKQVPYGGQMIGMAGLAYQLGAQETGDDILRAVYSNYYTKRLLHGKGHERLRMQMLKLTLDQAKRHKRTELAKELDKTVVY